MFNLTALLASLTTPAREMSAAPIIVLVALLVLIAVIITGPLGQVLAGRLGGREVTRTIEAADVQVSRAELEAVQREVACLKRELAELSGRPEVAEPRRAGEQPRGASSGGGS